MTRRTIHCLALAALFAISGQIARADEQIITVGRYYPSPGREAELEARLVRIAKYLMKTEPTVTYRLHRSAKEPAVFMFYGPTLRKRHWIMPVRRLRMDRKETLRQTASSGSQRKSKPMAYWWSRTTRHGQATDCGGSPSFDGQRRCGASRHHRDMVRAVSYGTSAFGVKADVRWSLRNFAF